ncbi:MAG: hypothetical protein IPJ48_11805 [Propionivibrio sp.]|uniref:Uncharacterized protein n=1 Tax=Candidatus Propionivibrio dominans TaxID=2954373 RepID=A0A9D7I7W6_9RHOO|nr:hypothetical protein [Candidatus Propionivibrio dominans]MBL0168669.1 hypothetical protein [Propionivibrio sp.]
MSKAITISDFSNTIRERAGALASAMSEAGKIFSERVAAEGGQAMK